VDDASFDNDGTVGQRQSQIVKGIEVKGKGRFNLSAAAAHLFDRHRLKHHDLSVEVAEDLDALRVPFIGRRHPAGL
jgi:hypothetical protein